MIEFRRRQPTVRRHHFLTGASDREDCWPDVSWYDPQGSVIDWNGDVLPILCVLAAPLEQDDPNTLGRDVLLIFNSSHESAKFTIPEIAKSRQWNLLVDTSAESPRDIYPNLDGPALESEHVCPLPVKSLKVYVAGKLGCSSWLPETLSHRMLRKFQQFGDIFCPLPLRDLF